MVDWETLFGTFFCFYETLNFRISILYAFLPSHIFHSCIPTDASSVFETSQELFDISIASILRFGCIYVMSNTIQFNILFTLFGEVRVIAAMQRILRDMFHKPAASPSDIQSEARYAPDSYNPRQDAK